MREVTDAERALLTAPNIEVSAGLELLDSSNRVVADLSDDLVGGSISRDNNAVVHGAARLQITRALAWGRDRVRPWMSVSDGATSARFNLGVYVMTTPEERRGEEPATFDVQGYDLLHLLQDGPGDTWTATAGTTYMDAVRAVVTAAGVGASVQMDGTRQDTTLAAPMVWALPERVMWLTIINDLLRKIGYAEVYANEDGDLRSGPHAPLAERGIEWTLNTSDASTNIVGEDRTVTEDVWDAPNRWRFIRSRLDQQPIEGAGIYTVVNQSDGPTSIDSLGRTRTRVEYLDVADQAALVSEGNRMVEEDRAVEREIKLSVDPLPCMGHRDVFRLIDAGRSDKVQAASWSLSLDGSPGSLVLGGAPIAPRAATQTQTTGTITQASPCRVVIDGATQDSVAATLDGAAYSLGTRVQVTVRNPDVPLVMGTETTGA